MLTYKDLYEKRVWDVKEVKDYIKQTSKMISIAGCLLREKILVVNDPLNWNLEIKLLCEVYVILIQALYHFDDISEGTLKGKKTIKVSSDQQVILKAFSENLELCQEELQREYFVFLSPNALSYN